MRTEALLRRLTIKRGGKDVDHNDDGDKDDFLVVIMTHGH